MPGVFLAPFPIWHWQLDYIVTDDEIRRGWTWSSRNAENVSSGVLSVLIIT